MRRSSSRHAGESDLVRARREGWAVGGFNVFNLESAGEVEAAIRQATAERIQLLGGAGKA